MRAIWDWLWADTARTFLVAWILFWGAVFAYLAYSSQRPAPTPPLPMKKPAIEAPQPKPKAVPKKVAAPKQVEPAPEPEPEPPREPWKEDWARRAFGGYE